MDNSAAHDLYSKPALSVNAGSSATYMMYFRNKEGGGWDDVLGMSTFDAGNLQQTFTFIITILTCRKLL